MIWLEPALNTVAIRSAQQLLAIDDIITNEKPKQTRLFSKSRFLRKLGNSTIHSNTNLLKHEAGTFPGNLAFC